MTTMLPTNVPHNSFFAVTIRVFVNLTFIGHTNKKLVLQNNCRYLMVLETNKSDLYRVQTRLVLMF